MSSKSAFYELLMKSQLLVIEKLGMASKWADLVAKHIGVDSDLEVKVQE